MGDPPPDEGVGATLAARGQKLVSQGGEVGVCHHGAGLRRRQRQPEVDHARCGERKRGLPVRRGLGSSSDTCARSAACAALYAVTTASQRPRSGDGVDAVEMSTAGRAGSGGLHHVGAGDRLRLRLIEQPEAEDRERRAALYLVSHFMSTLTGSTSGTVAVVVSYRPPGRVARQTA